MVDDTTLLRKFIEEHSEDAFRSFVERHFNFVYAVALRHAGSDTHLAREIAQNVFIDAARKARVLAPRTTVLGWLYMSARFTAAALLRARSRRIHHEQKAGAMNEILVAPSRSEINWDDLRPMIDEALAELSEPDREAILLRHFDDQNFAAVGAALGLGENAARMRVERALDKLRRRLARRGITSTAAALAATLASQPLIAAPAGMAAAVAGSSLAAAAGGGGLAGVAMVRAMLFMNTGKTTLIALGMIAALGLGNYWGTRHPTASPASSQVSALQGTVTKLEADNRRLQEALARQPAAPVLAVARVAKPAASFTPLQRLQVLADLQEKKWASATSAFLGPDGKLTSAFVGLFDLKPAEQESMQAAIERARVKLADLESANGKITRDANGDIVMSIQPFPTEGGKIYDETLNDIATILGFERNDAFRRLSNYWFEQAFGNFGVGERTYVFGYDERESQGPYTFHDTTVTRSSRGIIGRNEGGYAFRTFDELAAHAGPIVSVLPSDYRRTK